MTTEQAIKLLHRLQDEQFDGIHGDERREALEMAVRALESNLVKESGDLVQELVNDCISRKAVMKEFSNFVRRSNNSDFAPTPTWNDAVSLVGSMPSAQPETHEKRTETHACDLINRQVAIDAVVSAMIDGADAELVEGVMELLPSAQPQQKKGHWIGIDDYPYESWECDQCGCVYEKIPSWTPNFCPSCGADMRGESDE